MEETKTQCGVKFKKDLRTVKEDLLNLAPEELKTQVESYFLRNNVHSLKNVAAYATINRHKTLKFIRVKIQPSLDKAQNSKTLLTKMTDTDIGYENARFTADGNLTIDIPTYDTPADNITKDGIQTSLGLPEGTKIKIDVNKHKNKTTIVIDFKNEFVHKLNAYKDSVRHHYAELQAPPATYSTLSKTKSLSSAEEDPYVLPNAADGSSVQTIYGNTPEPEPKKNPLYGDTPEPEPKKNPLYGDSKSPQETKD